MNLLRHVDISNVSIRQSAATSLSDAVDMQGFEGCLFLFHGSTLLETGSTVLCWLKGSTASGGTYINLRGGSSTYKLGSSDPATGSKNYRLFAIDLYKPESDYRYIKAVIAGASSDVAYINGITAIKYGARKMGSTVLNQSTTIAASTIFVGPTSG